MKHCGIGELLMIKSYSILTWTTKCWWWCTQNLFEFESNLTWDKISQELSTFKGLSDSLWRFLDSNDCTLKHLKLSNLEFWRKQRHRDDTMAEINPAKQVEFCNWSTYFDRFPHLPRGEIICFFDIPAESQWKIPMWYLGRRAWALFGRFLTYIEEYFQTGRRSWKPQPSYYNIWVNIFWCTCVIWSVVMDHHSSTEWTSAPCISRRGVGDDDCRTKHTASNRFRWLRTRYGPSWFKYFAYIFWGWIMDADGYSMISWYWSFWVYGMASMREKQCLSWCVFSWRILLCHNEVMRVWYMCLFLVFVSQS